MLLLFLLLPFLVSSDELIAARCQSKCLHDMELRYQDNQEQKKNLKHQIIQMCKDDVLCSACASPCRESFSTLHLCKEIACKDSMDKGSCEHSCEFLERIYKEKPGACPKMSNSTNDECTALCHLDGDCGETAKCCSYGCSRQCMQPRGRDPRLLPVPISISIQERKRRRSIIIRWVLQKLTKEQANANANLFVVQWRWGLHTDSESMTEWQTVTVRNKPYAILKHLLSPGRFYEFRVGSVSQHGSLGFSKPSDPFKLSKEAKAPNSPRDLALGGSRLTPVGLWNQIIQWSPPASDLPIKSYQVSWAASSAAEADSFEEMMRRKATLDTHDKRSADEEEDAWGIEARDRHSQIVPSHSTQTEISGLFPNSVYIVEIHASVDSTEGELQGEKGIVFVRTADALNSGVLGTMITSTENSFENEQEMKTNENLDVPVNKENSDETQEIDVQTPFFDGELQTGINWLDARICSPGKHIFVVRVKKGECREYQTHTMDARWHDIRVNECASLLKGLSFDCDYHIQVNDIEKPENTLSAIFSTQPCDKTPSHSPIPCLSLTTPLLCSAHGATVSCKWSRDREGQETVIGYRVVLSSAHSDAHNITINPPQEREILYEQLKQGEMYTVQVQSITNRGMGKSFSTNFIAPSLFDENLLNQFPGGEIIELPLEASSSPYFTVLLSFFFVFLRLL